MEVGRIGTGAALQEQKLWVELDRPFVWADLIVSQLARSRLRAIEAEMTENAAIARERDDETGVVHLFVGERGTGKTMAAQVLGAELGLRVFQVDLWRLRGREAAEIESIFAAAERADAIIVFDHSRPSDERDGSDGQPDLDLDAAALVHRCKRHPGLAIFTWIPGESFHLIADEEGRVYPSFGKPVRFSVPSAMLREQIWRAELASFTELTDWDAHELANSYRLSVGAIKHCCLAARAIAEQQRVPVDAALLERTIAREYPDSTNAQREVALSAAVSRVRSSVRTALDSPRTALDSPRTVLVSAASGQGRRVLAAVVVVAAVLGVVLGLALAPANGPATPIREKQASNELLRVSVPANSRQQASPAAVAPGLANQLVVTLPGTRSGVLALGRSDATDPATIVRALTGASTLPASQIVSLGNARFYRYAAVQSRASASPVSVYILPTTAGTIVGVCATRAAGACERVLASIRLATGSELGAGPSAALGSSLDGVIATLTSARTIAEKRLGSARTAAAQASAAGSLAAAYARAAGAVANLQAGSASTATAAFAGALRGTADAYSALALAASHSDAKAYRAANARLSAAAVAISLARRQLQALGYQIA